MKPTPFRSVSVSTDFGPQARIVTMKHPSWFSAQRGVAPRRAISWVTCALGVIALTWGGRVAGAGDDPAGIEFFEKQIRPVLVEQCYNCHSSKAEKGIKGGLNLETRDGLRKGGERGVVLIPGQPERSLLLKAVQYTDPELQMPPKNHKLPEDVIRHLEAWIRLGAPDPRTNAVVASHAEPNPANHWAFRPIRKGEVPAVKNKSQVSNPVDAFLLARLEPKGLKLSPEADRRTLIRRLAFDLTGLPPTAAEVREFEADRSPDAYAKLVDRFLASPRYGERWGRYWLDVARYADTKGYVFEEERRYPYSYTYRDYVIRALNEDLPYDQFIREQLAADLLPLGDDKRPLAALGFLTLGRRFLNNQHDIIDDRIDVMTRGLMGLTVVCARCHDHKFDPIPTRDYYSLYGVFASAHEPGEKPLLGSASIPPEYPEYVAERKKREGEKAQYRADRDAEALLKVRSMVGSYLLAAYDALKLPAGEGREKLARERKLEPVVANKFLERYAAWSNQPPAVLKPWFVLASADSAGSSNQVGVALAALITKPEAAFLKPLGAAAGPVGLKSVAERYDAWMADAAKGLAKGTNTVADAAVKPASDFLAGADTPFHLNPDELHRLFDTPAQQKLRALQRKIDELDATHAGAPPRAMALKENDQPYNPHVFKRGGPGNVGDAVPRQFLEVVSGKSRKPFQKGGGRLEMADAVASKDNPLTARVMANRVWQYHFGTSLVRTPSDFGVRTEAPVHLEMLDYLSARFMEEGWSVKKLHRLILLSSAYRQSSAENPLGTQVDSGNALYWRQNRRRLDFEGMRDTMLTVCGKLDLKMGGHPVDITTEPFTTRRTVYGFVERQNLPGLFRTFDFASPDTTSSQRFSTTVPQQALFLMNSPFVAEEARAILNRPELSGATTDMDKVKRLHEILYQRKPDADELRLAREFLATPVTSQPQAEVPVWQYGYGEVDKSGRAVDFHPLPFFNQYSWQGGKDLPDATLGWVLLNAEGGHPGKPGGFAAIRRWVAPRDGTVAIEGTLGHGSEQGDGVRARIVSSRNGMLGEWVATHSSTSTPADKIKVKEGDTLDFVTDCRSNEGFDSFTWAPKVRYKGEGKDKGSKDPEVRRLWQAKEDFSGPVKAAPKGLSPWERYAQVLLLSNELFFVD